MSNNPVPKHLSSHGDLYKKSFEIVFNLKSQNSDKHSKLSAEKIKNEQITKPPKRTPTRSRRGRKRY